MTSRVTLEQLGAFAKTSGAIQERIVQLAAEPNAQKHLRLFSAPEAAKLLGISDIHLRGVVRDHPDLPQGTIIGDSNRRRFSLADVNTIRTYLDEHGKGNYLPNRDRLREKLQVLSVVNFKGGAGKTMTAIHLAQYFALRGYRVLLIDLDNQGSLTGLFGYQPDTSFRADQTLYRLIRACVEDQPATLKGLPIKTYWDGLDLIPANLRLQSAEYELPARQQAGDGFRFWRLLEEGIETIADDYDLVVCDCPPALSYLTLNAIYAATALIVPAPPAMMDYASTGQFFTMLQETMGELETYEKQEKTWDFLRILISKYNVNDQSETMMCRWIEMTYQEFVMRNRMAITTALNQAGNQKQTLYEMGRESKAYDRALEYLNLVNGEIEDMVRGVWGRALSVEAA